MTSYESLKLLIIEDDEDWQILISEVAHFLGYESLFVKDWKEAEGALQQAEKENAPFSIVTIDWMFEIGKEQREYQLGLQILRRIKLNYPHLGCIVISGNNEVSYELLKLRDKYNLDGFIPKAHFDEQTFEEELNKAVSRITTGPKTMAVAPSVTAQNDVDTVYLVHLHALLVKYFNQEELQHLCFELGVDYETLGGVGKVGKSRELIQHQERNGRLDQLVKLCQTKRSHVVWGKP